MSLDKQIESNSIGQSIRPFLSQLLFFYSSTNKRTNVKLISFRKIWYKMHAHFPHPQFQVSSKICY